MCCMNTWAIFEQLHTGRPIPKPSALWRVYRFLHFPTYIHLDKLKIDSVEKKNVLMGRAPIVDNFDIDIDRSVSACSSS